MTNDDIRLWLPPMLTLLGTLIVVVFTAWLNTRAVLAKFDAIDGRFDGVNTRFASMDKRLDGLHEDMRELRSDMKLLTGKVYEMMGQKG
jgi:hypothetical protein